MKVPTLLKFLFLNGMLLHNRTQTIKRSASLFFASNNLNLRLLMIMIKIELNSYSAKFNVFQLQIFK